jgi:hypothetical protein
MADSKLSALTAATAATGADELYVNDGGVSKRITVSNFLGNIADPISTSSLIMKSSEDSISAAGATQGAATPLTAQLNRVTTVTATTDDGVSLPAAAAGLEIVVINAHATDALAIWPATGDAINGGSANAEDSSALSAGSSRRYYAFDATNWYS